MGMSDTTRATMGTLRAFPSLHRRLRRLEEMEHSGATAALEERLGSTAALVAELNQRTLALSHQVEHLYALLEGADPQATLDIAVGVRDQVRELAVELTEQANRTSEVLAGLAGERA